MAVMGVIPACDVLKITSVLQHLGPLIFDTKRYLAKIADYNRKSVVTFFIIIIFQTKKIFSIISPFFIVLIKNLFFIIDTFITLNIKFIFVAKTVSVTDDAYDALVSIKRGKMTFSDVIMSMYNDLYGTVDEEEEEKDAKLKPGRKKR